MGADSSPSVTAVSHAVVPARQMIVRSCGCTCPHSGSGITLSSWSAWPARRRGSRWWPTRWTASRQISAGEPRNASWRRCLGCSCGPLSLTCAAMPGSRTRCTSVSRGTMRCGCAAATRSCCAMPCTLAAATPPCRICCGATRIAYAGYSAGPRVLAPKPPGAGSGGRRRCSGSHLRDQPDLRWPWRAALCDRAALPISRSPRKRSLRSGRRPVRRRRRPASDAPRRPGPGHRRRHQGHLLTATALSRSSGCGRTKAVRVAKAGPAGGRVHERLERGPPAVRVPSWRYGPPPEQGPPCWGRRAHRLEPDPATAPAVRWIFALAGHSVALDERLGAAAGMERTVITSRREQMPASMRFLDALGA